MAWPPAFYMSVRISVSTRFSVRLRAGRAVRLAAPLAPRLYAVHIHMGPLRVVCVWGGAYQCGGPRAARAVLEHRPAAYVLRPGGSPPLLAPPLMRPAARPPAAGSAPAIESLRHPSRRARPLLRGVVGLGYYAAVVVCGPPLLRGAQNARQPFKGRVRDSAAP